MKIIINNIINLEEEDKDKWRAIHYICRYLTEEMIKYMIEKGVNLECETNNKWKTIHFICKYSTEEMIKYTR
jgi:ankyrin repeat protein